MTLQEIKSELKRMDPNIDTEDQSYKAAVIMLAGSFNELFTVRQLLNFTGYEWIFIKECTRNLKKEGIWKQVTGKGKTHQWKVYHSGWFDKDSGGIAFWIDVSRVLGFITTQKP